MSPLWFLLWDINQHVSKNGTEWDACFPSNSFYEVINELQQKLPEDAWLVFGIVLLKTILAFETSNTIRENYIFQIRFMNNKYFEEEKENFKYVYNQI